MKISRVSCFMIYDPYEMSLRGKAASENINKETCKTKFTSNFFHYLSYS